MKRRKHGRRLAGLLYMGLSAVAIACLTLSWGSLYRYEELGLGRSSTTIRIHQITGGVEVIEPDGTWVANTDHIAWHRNERQGF